MTRISTQSSLRSQRLFSLTSPEENSMLKISFSETPAEERWILHGLLTDPWVQEFRACWQKNHRTEVRRACIVDLNEVTFIDKCGEDRKSTRLNSSHGYISYAVFCLKKKKKKEKIGYHDVCSTRYGQ